MRSEKIREKILLSFGESIKEMERLELISKYWLKEEKGREELSELINEMKKLWKKLDLFLAVYLVR